MLRLIRAPGLRASSNRDDPPKVRQGDALRSLAAKTASGDEMAARSLLIAVGPAVLMTVRRVLGTSHPEIDDICQEVSIGLLSALPSFRSERLIESSAMLRAALLLGQDFDRIAAVQAGDEVRIARFVTGALEARGQQRVIKFASRRRSGWLLVAAVLSVCGVAYGLRGAYWPKKQPAPVPSLQEFGERKAPPRRSPALIGQAATAAASSKSETKAEESVSPASTRDDFVHANEGAPKVTPPLLNTTRPTAAQPELGVMDAPVSSSAVRLPAAGKFVEAAPSGADAATLLRQANLARSQGYSKLAISLFKELQQTYPNSLEAVVSHVSLGKLLAASGAATAAIQEFTTYLTIDGPLAEEALFGRAQALATLGRHGEERFDLQALIARFPGSVYMAKAKERLQVLSHDTNR